MSFRFLAVIFLASSAYAQPGVAPAFHIQNATAFVQYYSTAPETFLRALPQRNTGAAGAGATVAYTKFNERSGLTMSYSPSFIAGFRSLQGNSSNHYFSLTGRTGLTSRLRFNYSASGSLSSTSDYLFTPTQLAKLASASATPGELASAVVTGSSTNNEVGTVLAEAPGAGTPVGLGVYGDRMWTASVVSGVRYAYTPRLAFYMNLGATRNEHLSRTGAPGSRETYLLPYTMTGFGRAGLAYLLSPRTRLGVDLQSDRSFSKVQDAYGSAASLSLARVMGPSWFVNLHGGVGMINVVRSSRPLKGGLQPTGGGGVGYRTFANTFFVSVERSSGDAYALGTSASLMANAAWSWNRPGNPWLVTCDLSNERLSGGGYPPFNARRALAGVGRRLGGHFSLLLQYAYLSTSERVEQAYGTRLNLHTGRLSFVWEPYGGHRGNSSAE